MAQPIKVPAVRKIPSIGNNVPREAAVILKPMREAIEALTGDDLLGAIRRNEFMKLLRDGVRVPGVLPPPVIPPPEEGPNIDDYLEDLRKLQDQARLDALGIYQRIEVNETLAKQIHTIALDNLVAVTEHAEDLAEQADELAAHALELIDLATDLDTIYDEFHDPVTGLVATSTLLEATVVRVDANEDSIDVITAQVTALQSEIVDTSSLDPGIIWQFENAAEGWTSNVTLTDNSFYESIAAGASAYFRSPSGIAIDGRLYTRIVARIRRVSGTGWLGRASYATTGGGAHGIDTANFHLTIATAPILAGGGWVIVVWDMEGLTAGGTDWVDHIIDQIQLELSDDGSTVFEVDWVAIGRIAPSYVTGVISALESRVTQTETDITALSSAVTALETDVTGLEGDVSVNASAIDTLDTRVTVAEGSITSNSSAITSLDLRLDDAEADITASASALTGLDTRLTSAEGTITSHSSDITALENSVVDLDTDIGANSSAITSLDSRVDVTETDITAHASRLTALEVSVDDPTTGLDALATLVDSFDTRITATEDSVDAFVFQITALESQVDDLDADVSGFAGAITTLNTRVSTAESSITSQASLITLLQSRGGGFSGNRVNPLDGAGHAIGWTGLAGSSVFQVTIGGRTVTAGRWRTSGNLQVVTEAFSCEPHEILECRFSVLKNLSDGRIYIGMNGLNDAGTTAQTVTAIQNRSTGTSTNNPYWFHTNPNSPGPLTAIQWLDVVFYLCGSAVLAQNVPRGRVNNLEREDAIAAMPWISNFIDGWRLQAGTRRARVRVLNFENTVQTDVYVTAVTVKPIDNQFSAAVAQEATARASGDSANASSIQTVSTTVGGHTASINSLTTSINGIAAQWVMQLDINGRITGLRLAGSPTSTSFTILADQFSIVMPGVGAVVPFTVGLVNGIPTVGIQGNLIVDGTVAARSIASGGVGAESMGEGTALPQTTLNPNFILLQLNPPVRRSRASVLQLVLDVSWEFYFEHIQATAAERPLVTCEVILTGRADNTGAETFLENRSFSVTGVSSAIVGGASTHYVYQASGRIIGHMPNVAINAGDGENSNLLARVFFRWGTHNAVFLNNSGRGLNVRCIARWLEQGIYVPAKATI